MKSIRILLKIRSLEVYELEEDVFYDDFFFDDEYRNFMRYNVLYRSLKSSLEEMGSHGCLLNYEGFGLYGDERDKEILEEHWFWHVIMEFMHQELVEWSIVNVFRPNHGMI
jgi:hypothetical protein